MRRVWSGRFSMVLLIPLIVLCFGGGGDPGARQHDPLLAGEGRSLRFSELGAVEYLMVCSADDCPTCYEFAIAEAGRLVFRTPWEGRCALIVVAGSPEETSFAALLRGRYNLPLPIFTAARDSLVCLFPPAP